MEETRQEETQPITMNEARAHVARLVATSLRATITSMEEMPAAVLPVEATNRRNLLQASKELHDLMLLNAKKMDRPRILVPRRSMKVVRS